MSDVVVVGASGFGREALDVLEAMQSASASIRIVGVLDDFPSLTNLERLEARGIEYLGTSDQWLAVSPKAKFVLGIGDPAIRRRIARQLLTAGARPFDAIHPNASIGSAFVAGQGLVVCAGAVISTNVRFGEFVHVNPGVTIGHDTHLGDYVSVNPAAVLSGEVAISAGTLIGAAAVVLQGLTIGEDALVGAAALVTHDVPPGVTAKGLPARW